MPASAQTPEVQVDPNSPAGTEYAIPLDKARQDAAGDKGTSGKRGGKSDLFGAGIEKQSEEPPPPPPAEATEAPEPVPAEPAEEQKSERPKKRSKDRPKKPSKEASNPSPAATSSEGDDPAPHKTAAAVDAASDDGSPGLVMGGIAVGVLGVGLLVGVGLRRLFRGA